MNPPVADTLTDRYPGLRSFSSDEQHLFFGRKKETDDLLDLVRAEQITVLFAKSGLGKSSLLNAGLKPKLEALHYRVIPIRLQQKKAGTTDPDSTDQPVALSDNPLLNIVLTQLHGEFRKAWQEQTPPNEFEPFYDPDLELRKFWEEIKTHPFPDGSVPVFFFDQFEELFIYKQADQDKFIGQLSELMNDQTPNRIMKWLLQTDVDDRTMEMMNWSKQPLVKCLFSIRADRLFEMHKLKAMIPLILRNRYELLPLSDDCAREAIERPAQADGQFTTPPFTYNEATRELIIRRLSIRKAANNAEPSADFLPDVCEIESSQLQIVCHYIETKIKEKVARGEAPVVGPDIIKEKANAKEQDSIDRIIDKFYRQQLRQLGTTQEIEKVRLVLENELLVDKHRVGLAAMRMRKLLGDDATADKLIDTLMEVRLIRADDSHLGRTYELSHDTLIEPVEKVKQLVTAWQHRKAQWVEKRAQEQNLREQKRKFDREEQQRKLFQRVSLYLFVAVSFAVVSTLAALYFLVNGHINLAQANRDWAVDEYNAGNQRMAYRLWESNLDLVWWIPFYKNNAVDQRADSAAFRFAPFAGATTQFSLQDDSIRYVASLFHNNMFEVWQSDPTNTSFEKIDSFTAGGDTLQINALSATRLQLQNNRLIVFKHDSLLQIFDLATKARVFPGTASYYPLCTANDQLTTVSPAKSDGFVHSFKPVLLSPSGNRLAVIDSNGHAHLFDLSVNSRQKPHPLFEKLISPILEFNLQNLQFSSTGDSVLIKVPDQNRFELLDLRMNRLASTYANTVYARFSPSGRYLLGVSTSGQLTIHDLQTKNGSNVLQLPPTARFGQLIINQNESTLLIDKPSAGGITYTLYGVDLRQRTPSLYQIATNVITHQAGATNVLYSAQTNAHARSIYLYNLPTGKRTDVTTALSGNSTAFIFYAQRSRGGISLIEDKNLIQATPRHLTIYNLGSLLQDRRAIADTLAVAGNSSFKPVTLTSSGPVISIKNQNDIQLSFFANGKKNRPDYIYNHIYPPLSRGDRDAAGLSAN